MLCPNCQTVNADGSVNCSACGRVMKLGVGTVLSGRYEIQKLIGQGGMGTVYKAHDKVLDETVAIKVLRPEMIGDEDASRRFLAEIKTARKIAHRNVCRIYEYGDDHGLRFISMAYIEGVDLKAILREAGPLPWPEGFEIAIRVTEALQAIHDEGIVHRDLKTPNIMRDQKGVVRVMDFGIAKDAAGSGMTQTGMIMGTPEYMSAEQATGGAIDFRTDLYALGVVIFELFTGSLPFRSDTPLSTLMKQIQDPPPLDGPEAARIPPSALPILRRLLAKSAAERFDSTEMVVDALKAARTETLGTGAITAPILPAPSGAQTAVIPGTPTAVSPPTARAPAAPPPLPPPYVPPPLPTETPYAAAPAPAAKSSRLPWILGGAALLFLMFVGLAFVGLFFAGTATPPVASPSPTVARASPAPTTTQPSASASTAPPAEDADADDGPKEGTYAPPAESPGDDDDDEPEDEPAVVVRGHSWRVAHDHGSAFQALCVGALYLKGDMLGFKSPEHRFQVAIGSVREIKRNDVYGSNFGAFHVKLRNGQNYNLAAVTPKNYPVDPRAILDTLNIVR